MFILDSTFLLLRGHADRFQLENHPEKIFSCFTSLEKAMVRPTLLSMQRLQMHRHGFIWYHKFA